ncbi:MAG: hypothetical protein FJ317_09220, partial [SAR202 cluster bacterium]|nr:hypothetical protein [SAR202 cluster bacterium]
MKALAISFASLVMRLVTWWWERTSAAWSHAYGEPMLELRLLYLLIAAIVSVVLIPVAFKDMGIVGGISYLFALFMATSNAT